MKLRKKSMIWSIILGLLFVLNLCLLLFAIHELKVTNRITSEDYEISASVRQLRSSVFEFYALGLDTSTQYASPRVRRDFIESKERLVSLIQDSHPSHLHPDLRSKWDATLENIRNLLSFVPSRNTFDSATISLMNPKFRELFESVQSELNLLSDLSNEVVKADRAYNEKLIRYLFQVSVGLNGLAFFLIISILYSIRSSVLLPIQSLVETLHRIRSGDLTAHWKQDRNDEIGLIGQTLNEAVAELQQRRNDRIQLISAVAHDLKNPLTALSLNCDLFFRNRSNFNLETTEKIITNVRSQVDRLKRMTEDLLNAASAVKPSLELRFTKFNLFTLLLEIVELFRNSYPDRRVLFEPETQAFEVFADQDRVAQTLTNLLSNAIKYSLPATEILIKAGLAPGNDLQSDLAYIEVWDQGIGIPEDKVATIFQPFTRLEKGTKMSSGLGLGLATVLNIVQAHSGKITIRPRPGGGSIFKIEIPLDSRPT